jgi:hypothetical protein
VDQQTSSGQLSVAEAVNTKVMGYSANAPIDDDEVSPYPPIYEGNTVSTPVIDHRLHGVITPLPPVGDVPRRTLYAAAGTYDALGNLQPGEASQVDVDATTPYPESVGKAITTSGKLLYGGLQTGVAAGYNWGVKIAGGAVSVPAWLLDGVAAAVGVQEEFRERYGYTLSSEGAQMVARGLAPAGALANQLQMQTRSFSEQYIGDAGTTFLGVGLDAGSQIFAVTGAARGVRGLLEVEEGGSARVALPQSEELAPHLQAARNGFPGVKVTQNGGPTFAGTDYLYPVQSGERNIVEITMTGTRSKDFELATRLANLVDKVPDGANAPQGYVWHHVDNFDPLSGRATLELIQRDAHIATLPHIGSVRQYESYYRVIYGK